MSLCRDNERLYFSSHPAQVSSEPRDKRESQITRAEMTKKGEKEKERGGRNRISSICFLPHNEIIKLRPQEAFFGSENRSR